MKIDVVEACISNVAINAVSSNDGSPQVAICYDGFSIYDSPQVAYIKQAGFHVAEKATRISRRCETFGGPREWTRNVRSAYLEHLGNKGNHKPKPSVGVTVIDIGDISEVMPPLLSEEEKPHGEDEGKYVVSPEGIVSPLSDEKEDVFSEEVWEVFGLEIESKSACLSPRNRINDIGDFCPLAGRAKKILVSQGGQNIQNILYADYRPSPYGSHHAEHQISHDRE